MAGANSGAQAKDQGPQFFSFCDKAAPLLAQRWDSLEPKPEYMRFRHGDGDAKTDDYSDDSFTSVKIVQSAEQKILYMQGDFYGELQDIGADGTVDKYDRYNSSASNGSANYSDAQRTYDRECRLLLPNLETEGS